MPDMIDIHCHILPGLDDGPSNISESLEMASIALGDGIRKIVATPHVRDASLSPDLIRRRMEELKEGLSEEGLPLEIFQGADADAMLDPSLMKGYAINNTNYILVEFPHTHMPIKAGEALFRMAANGLRPIITHPERNASVIKNPASVISLLGTGALIQLTAESLTGGFGPEVRECALYLLRQRAVHIIATDAHSARLRRPVLSGALRAAEKDIGEEEALRLVSSNPEAVLLGRALDV